MDTADAFHAAAGLGEVRVVDYQACRGALVVTADNHLPPELETDVIAYLPPVDAGIIHETVEDILLAADIAAQGCLVEMIGIANHEAGIHQQSLQHLQQGIHHIAPACASEQDSLSHVYTFNYLHDGKHCAFYAVFSEETADF
jgi:hypothetical protein